MKRLFLCTILLFLFNACHRPDAIIIQTGFVDSLISNYTQPGQARSNQKDIEFWKGRINPANPGLVNESRYAGQLATRFRLLGDIRDLKSADSILLRVDSVFNHKEGSVFLAMVGHCISQHRFKEAALYLEKARALGIKPYESCVSGFDVDFELGNYASAQANHNKIRSPNDYGYFFRKAKWQHYKGNLDSGIAAMQDAFTWAGSDTGLQQAALSNSADLYLHAGKLADASNQYTKSIRLNAGDMHSLMGLGWIALVHDKNIGLAEKIFSFARVKTKLPDPAYKLEEAAEERNDSSLEKKYAEEFITLSSDSLYGNMYNKYMIDLYTGVLNNPASAEILSLREIEVDPLRKPMPGMYGACFAIIKPKKRKGIMNNTYPVNRCQKTGE